MTNHYVHEVNGEQITVFTSKETVIDNPQLFLDIIFNLPTEKIVLYKENLHESFFDLKSGVAGELLQKIVNYSMSLGIVGDFSVYQSKSLRDFIYESNKSNRIVFVSTLEEALDRLSR
ncbi:DUF4180 domain-containing protein [Ohtaekwangia koreensis]|uniref:DUF4180 domain-containing protein n=1 Tax=Ohtaekwangia koreensis TaxID=688867 RepID=A0A1T5M6N7_9BACT|nr:DUF4180 domain-containing protein [Ohtaekwangia koreensis]SKC83891.1 protein of unknown function [Ohtaekwangia koreensis]